MCILGLAYMLGSAAHAQATGQAKPVPAPPAQTAAQAPAGNPTSSQSNTSVHVSQGQQAAAASEAKQAAAAQTTGALAPQGKPVVLDSVVAIINGQVLLESDVEQERRFEALQLLPASQNTDARAAQHLITRTLILEQMKVQGQTGTGVTTADVDKFVAQLKKQLPGCLPTRCQSEAGWASYLAERGMTPDEVASRWRQRLIILEYLNLRFRTGIRIPPEQVQTYYEQTLLPQFRAKHVKAPALKSLRPRIEEVLLQQQVSKQIDGWEQTLRQEGSVQILVPAYGESNSHAEDQSDVPGGAL